MPPNSALTAIIARLNAASFIECQSPNGLMDGGPQRLNQGFYVRPLQIKFLKGRHKSDVAGARVSMTFEVQLGHICKPSSGVPSSATALTDIQPALKYLFAPNTTLTSGAGAAIYTNGVTVSYQEGGSYIIQKCVIDLRYNLDLTP